MARKRLKRSDRLLRVLDGYRDTIVVTHNTPDPDAIASGWAICSLVRHRLQKPVRLLGRGPVLRAENIQFLELLKPPIELVDEIRPDAQTAFVLVDCGPASLNHLLAGHRPPHAVVDHHESKGDRIRIPFRDIRPSVTASASITTQYMREQKFTPPPKMATAMLYAIRTEMRGAPVRLSQLDHSALKWLSAFVKHDLLFQIEYPVLRHHYYEELLLALDRARLYADSAVCFLPRITSPELVGEVADLLIRCEDLNSVLCAGRMGDELLLSARSKGPDRDSLSPLARVVSGLGHFGGHRHRAGGKIGVSATGLEIDELERKVRTRWLVACGTEQRRGQRLVRRR